MRVFLSAYLCLEATTVDGGNEVRKVEEVEEGEKRTRRACQKVAIFEAPLNSYSNQIAQPFPLLTTNSTPIASNRTFHATWGTTTTHHFHSIHLPPAAIAFVLILQASNLVNIKMQLMPSRIPVSFLRYINYRLGIPLVASCRIVYEFI